LPGKPITYRGESLGKVFLKGSELWSPQWREHSTGVFYATPDAALFDDDAYIDSHNPFRVPLASTPYNRQGKPEKDRFGYGDPTLSYNCGQIILNGKPLTQVPFLEEVEKQAGTWTCDQEQDRIYVHFGALSPSEQTVEITTRRRIFAPHTIGLGYITVEGFVMEHCGNNYPTNFWNTPKWAQAGALGLRGGHHWIVRNNMIRYANTAAIDFGFGGGNNERPIAGTRKPTSDEMGADNLIESNYLVDNGAAGAFGAQSIRVIIRDNVIMRNNTLGFIGNKRYEHAGIKCHGIRDGLIEHNYVADNPLNDGIWLDNRFPGARVTRNVVVNNGVKGIFLEMSDQSWDSAFVDHNILVGNHLHQYYVHDASGATFMHNLVANSPASDSIGQGAYIYQVTARTRTYQHSLFNNLFVSHRCMMDINYPSHRGGPQRLDHNVYDTTSNERDFLVNASADKPSPWTADEFFALVNKNLGETATGIDSIRPRKKEKTSKARLTFDQWKAFWATHDQRNDVNSILQTGIEVTYTPETQHLRIEMPFDPASVGATVRENITHDFFKEPLSTKHVRKPGPFQKIKRGVNEYKIWDGLPILNPGQLPTET
ncbi:MAG: right-handed parallel beta-helix repeat-containing protein, partial [Rhodopirellula sp. JB044]|uniref:right-handed parallel beta-helix repeat-containing protein n=1 Tax=Rhodopirellula sp. JB044 TaxID=3342844 RepID=UPI00370B9888